MKKFMLFTTFLSALPLLYSTGCQFTSSTVEAHIVDKFEKTYSVSPGGRLTLVSEFGEIDVQTATQDKVELLITKESKFKLARGVQEALADFEVAFEHEGSDVHIEGTFKHGREHWRKKLNRLKIRFQVTVPQQYNVDLATSSGSISVADLDGEVRAKTSGGSLRFGNVKGRVTGRTSGGSIKLTSCGNPIDLKTSGGSIEVGDVAGEVKAETSGGSLRFGEIQGTIWGKTSGGNIKLAACRGDAQVETSGGSIILKSVAGAVNAKTSGGSIRAVMTTQPEHDGNLHTSGGGIVVTLIPDIAVDVEARTSGGRVSTDFPVMSVIQGKAPQNRLKGTINGGGPLLKLRTSGGNIQLQKAAE